MRHEHTALPPPLRLMVEEAIETLILLLDEINGDPDEEGTPDEYDGTAELSEQRAAS